jgi:AraC-like DNA-binding protein
MHVIASKLSKEKFNKLVSFDMQFNLGESNTIRNHYQRTVIERIAFNRPFSFIGKLILGSLAFFYSGLGIFVIVRRFLVSRLAMPKQKSLEVATYREQDLARIRKFIESHYSDPDISIRMLYKSLGIPPEKVFALVLSEDGLTFKQLINKMRIEEAKRLLRESDLRITDIAMTICFNELTCFNRLIKKYEKLTPSEFRDNAISK